MNAVDTNILVYVDDPREPRKQRIAATLVDSLQDGVLLWQVAGEYLNTIRRIRRTDDALAEGHRRIRETMRVWRFVEPQAPVIDLAVGLLGRYSLSFWDSMIVAACLHAGVERLYTEDFSAYPRIDSLEIVNPFAG